MGYYLLIYGPIMWLIIAVLQSLLSIYTWQCNHVFLFGNPKFRPIIRLNSSTLQYCWQPQIVWHSLDKPAVFTVWHSLPPAISYHSYTAVQGAGALWRARTKRHSRRYFPSLFGLLIRPYLLNSTARVCSGNHSQIPLILNRLWAHAHACSCLG